MDLSLNDEFSVHLDDRNDLGSVEGRDAFEQSVVLRVTDRMYDSIMGSTTAENIEEKIHLAVSRVARTHDQLDGIANIEITQPEGKPDTYAVEVQYAEAGGLTFEVGA